MTENPEFDLDSEWLLPQAVVEPTSDPAEPADPPAPAAVAAVEPVVVIQYRNRGMPPVLLLPITLIGSFALFAGYHAYLDPADARGVAAATRAVPRSTPAVDVESQAASALAEAATMFPGPLTLEGRPASQDLPPFAVGAITTPTPDAAPVAPEVAPTPTAPTPEPASQPEPMAVAEASPPSAEPVEPVAAPAAVVDPAVDVAAVRNVRPADEPLPTQEEMMERIRQEAELRAIQRAELERREREGLEQLRADAAQKAEDERADFRRELRSILKRENADAGTGAAIDALCDQFGRIYSEGVKQRAYAVLARNKGRLTSDAEVRILRSLGVPEPAVLDFLCNRVSRSLHSRSGPHSADEVRVAAARQLLRIPSTGVAVAVPEPTPPASPARSPIYRRSSR